MIPIKLTLVNFMPYRQASLSFDGIHIACLCGNNGNGKSSLLDAITWALWGKSRARSDDDLIHQGQAEMSVELEFSLSRQTYRVIRKRSKPKPSRPGRSLLDFQLDTGQGYKSIAGNTISETERKIVETLRMDYDTFVNSAYLVQGHADEFTRAQPAKRKDVLSSILGLSRYDELELRARERARKAEKERRELEYAISVIDEELCHRSGYEERLKQVEQDLAELVAAQRDKTDKLNALTRQQNIYDLKTEQRSRIQADIGQTKQLMSTLEEQLRQRRLKIDGYDKVMAKHEAESSRIRHKLNQISSYESRLQAKREELERISNEMHELSASKERLKNDMSELKEKIVMLSQEGANCPLCERELDPQSRQRTIDNYERQGQERKLLFRSSEERYRSLEKDATSLRHDIAQMEREMTRERIEWERLAASMDREHSEAQKALPAERQAAQDIEHNLENLRQRIADGQGSLETLHQELVALPQLESELGHAQKALEDLEKRQAAIQQDLGAIQAHLERCTAREIEKKQKSTQLQTTAMEEEIYLMLTEAFGKKGIQAMLIENALPEVEEEANRLLARMTDNRMHVRLETQRPGKTKGGEPAETLDINISDEIGTRRYEMYSGGEAFRIDFALRIALSRVLSRRAGSPLPILIVDEGFGSQDTAGRERLVEAIISVQDDFEMILVISHIDELKDVFPIRIEVTKTAQGSSIEVSQG